MWIKICANTSLEDAKLAAELGADAVGFVFAPSVRRVTVAEVAQITPHLPAQVERVGVFPALPAEEIAQAVQQAQLTAVQLHGGFDAELIERLHRLLGETAIIQTVHWQVDADEASGAAVRAHLSQLVAQGIVERVLIDSKVGNATGGTGTPFDWKAARIALSEAARGLKLIVAGGLRPENVAEAIANLEPWGVDVASGVEAEPRRKSPEKLEAFLRNARGAESPSS